VSTYPTLRSPLVPPGLLFVVAFLVGTLTATADTIYQVTILPSIDPDFYGPGENLDNFVSTEFNSTGNLPPMFSEIQITFTVPTLDTANINTANNYIMRNMTVVMPELNNQASIPQGGNIVPCAVVGAGCWFATLQYTSALANPAPQDTMFLDIDNSNFGEGQEWLISLDFPADASAVGNATGISVVYVDHADNNGATFYCSTGVSGCTASGEAVVTPEPAAFWPILAGLGLMGWKRRRMVDRSQS